MNRPAVFLLGAMLVGAAIAPAEPPFSISIDDYGPERTLPSDSSPEPTDTHNEDDAPIVDDATDPRLRVLQFQPGQRWLLTHACLMTELLSNNEVDSGENADEFLLVVQPSDREGCADLLISRSRFWGFYQHEDNDPTTYDSDDPSEEEAPVFRWFLIRRYVATVDSAGRIVAFRTADKLPADGPVEAHPRWSEASWAAAVRTAVGNAIAYVPPNDAAIGETWTVARNRLVPAKHYNLTVATGGATHMDEVASCTIDAIDGPVATVSVSCYREPIYGARMLRSPPLRPHDMVTGTGRPDVSFDSGGHVQINLDTGEISSLSLTTRITADEQGMGYVSQRTVDGESRRGFVRDGRGSQYLELTETVTLVRVDEEPSTRPAPSDAEGRDPREP